MECMLFFITQYFSGYYHSTSSAGRFANYHLVRNMIVFDITLKKWCEVFNSLDETTKRSTGANQVRLPTCPTRVESGKTNKK